MSQSAGNNRAKNKSSGRPEVKVFISWSGPTSEKLGDAIRNWLPNVIQSIEPYFTPADVDKGARWFSDIMEQLSHSTVGILCVTHDNIESEWLLFEAGALSTRLERSRVCPLLFGVKPTDLAGPLKQFQATTFSRSDFRKLILVINDCLGEKQLAQKTLETVFDKWWPDLEETIQPILAAGPTLEKPVRSDRNIMEELLQLARSSAVQRRPVSPAAIRDLLKAYIALHDQQAHQDGGYQETLDSLRELHSPIVALARRQAELPNESKKLLVQLESLPHKVVPKNEDEDEDEESPF